MKSPYLLGCILVTSASLAVAAGCTIVNNEPAGAGNAVASSTSSGAGGSGGAGPGTSFATAIPLVIGDPNGATGDLVVPATSKDFYSFQGTKGEAIVISATAEGRRNAYNASFLDTVITLYNAPADTAQIAQDDDPWPLFSYDAQLFTILPADGTYYVVVNDCNAAVPALTCGDPRLITTNTYTITVGDLNPSVVTQEGKEPGNDTTAGAAVVKYNTLTGGPGGGGAAGSGSGGAAESGGAAGSGGAGGKAASTGSSGGSLGSGGQVASAGSGGKGGSPSSGGGIGGGGAATIQREYLPSLVYGQFQSGTDKDYFSFTIPTDDESPDDRVTGKPSRTRASFWVIPSGSIDGDGSTTPPGNIYVVDPADPAHHLSAIDDTNFDNGEDPVNGPAEISVPVTPGKPYWLVVEHSSLPAGSNDFYFIQHASSAVFTEEPPVETSDVANNVAATAEPLTSANNQDGSASFDVDGSLSSSTDVDYYSLAIPASVSKVSGFCVAEREGSGLRGLTYELVEADGMTVVPGGSQVESASMDNFIAAPSGGGIPIPANANTLLLKVSTPAPAAPDPTVTDGSYICRIVVGTL